MPHLKHCCCRSSGNSVLPLHFFFKLSSFFLLTGRTAVAYQVHIAAAQPSWLWSSAILMSQSGTAAVPLMDIDWLWKQSTVQQTVNSQYVVLGSCHCTTVVIFICMCDSSKGVWNVWSVWSQDGANSWAATHLIWFIWFISIKSNLSPVTNFCMDITLGTEVQMSSTF